MPFQHEKGVARAAFSSDAKGVTHVVEKNSGTLPSWWRAIGPGAIVASLTIGSGELIFSTRAGALFGYKVLGVFFLVLLLKWALVLASAHHWAGTGAHPFQRWAQLPGPRGWLPMTFLLLALPAFPIWVFFHAGTVGTLLAALTDSTDQMNGGGPIVWGILALLLVRFAFQRGGYALQEKIQTVVIVAMLAGVVVSLVLLQPDWVKLLGGFFQFGLLRYPDWAAGMNEFASRPVWVEAATYAGVIGGGGYDYLAYVTWLREKHATVFAQAIAEESTQGEELTEGASRRWLRRTILMDSLCSFAAVLVFTVVFVACGALVLEPQRKVPGGSDLLTLQAQFVNAVGPWMTPLYFAGALLAMGGTLYGTVEVAPALFREWVAVMRPRGLPEDDKRVREWAAGWAIGGGLLLLTVALVARLFGFGNGPVPLIAVLTPVNLFSGVMACGVIGLFTVWAEWRFVETHRRAAPALLLLNLAAGAVFLGLGVKGYLDHSGRIGLGILGGTLLLGCVGALVARSWRAEPKPPAQLVPQD